MTKQNGCSANPAEINLVLEAKGIVIWAGELTEPGEPVGGIGTQNQRASRHLQLPIGVIVRARYERSGPEIYPCIVEARDRLLERLAKSPWSKLGGAFVQLQQTVGYQPRTPADYGAGPQRISRCG